MKNNPDLTVTHQVFTLNVHCRNETKEHKSFKLVDAWNFVFNEFEVVLTWLSSTLFQAFIKISSSNIFCHNDKLLLQRLIVLTAEKLYLRIKKTKKITLLLLVYF